MDRIIRSIVSGLGILATIATVIMMFSISADVFYRVFYNKSLPGLLEISETSLVAAVFLGMGYTALTNSHVAVDLLVSRINQKIAHVLIAIAWVLTSGLVGWMFYATLHRAMQSTAEREVRMGLIAWPQYPARWIIVIGLGAMLIVSIFNVIRLLRGKNVYGDSGLSEQERVVQEAIAEEEGANA
jgi:TRAP-type C4-dicarboxylate transport system permease small subunit